MIVDAARQGEEGVQKGSDGMMDQCLPQTHRGDDDGDGDSHLGDDGGGGVHLGGDSGGGDVHRCLPQTHFYLGGDDDDGYRGHRDAKRNLNSTDANCKVGLSKIRTTFGFR